MGPWRDERPTGGGRGVVCVVAGDGCSGYFLFAADAAVLAALVDAFPMLDVVPGVLIHKWWFGGRDGDDRRRVFRAGLAPSSRPLGTP